MPNTFEQKIGDFLRQRFPCRVLSNISLFSPTRFRQHETFGYEIDHLLHVRQDGEQRLVIVECKGSPVRVAGGKWLAPTLTGEKDVKRQVRRQAQALREHLGLGQESRIDGVVVCRKLKSPPPLPEVGGTEVFRLCDETRFHDIFGDLSQLSDFLDLNPLEDAHVLRVEQSSAMHRTRLGLVSPSLGHPEIANAIQYVQHCRRLLDGRLFDNLDLTNRRWAINGSAGMGKSVLLAYAICVAATGQRISETEGGRTLVEYLGEGKGLPPFQHRRILVTAVKQKQLEVLTGLWEWFISEFNRISGGAAPALRLPVFNRWSRHAALDGFNVLFIDEAHDLTDRDQRNVAAWWASPRKPYLVIACDRHQKLRLIGQDEPMLKGVRFRGCTKTLRHMYRSPVPIFAASLSLMFRWYAPSGPKIVPSRSQLAGGFGFDVEEYTEDSQAPVTLKMHSDAHPANYWSFLLSRFDNAETAYSWLHSTNVPGEDVLWVRFVEADPDFDYENLSEFTYHSLNSNESADMVNTYVKGREFPVVVIEGLPDELSCLDRESTTRMWFLRRQLYVCCSRSTAFLYFVVGRGQTRESRDIDLELSEMVRALSRPANYGEGGSKFWRFSFQYPSELGPMDEFSETADAVPVSPVSVRQGGEDEHTAPAATRSIYSQPPRAAGADSLESAPERPQETGVTRHALATELGESYMTITKLMEVYGQFPENIDEVVLPSIARKIRSYHARRTNGQCHGQA